MSGNCFERAIAARKIRTHCKSWTVDQVLDELVALDKKYGCYELTAANAEIESLKAQLAECRDKTLEEAATVVDGRGKYIGMECDPDITSKAIRSLKATKND